VVGDVGRAVREEPVLLHEHLVVRVPGIFRLQPERAVFLVREAFRLEGVHQLRDRAALLQFFLARPPVECDAKLPEVATDVREQEVFAQAPAGLDGRGFRDLLRDLLDVVAAVRVLDRAVEQVGFALDFERLPLRFEMGEDGAAGFSSVASVVDVELADYVESRE
jgi:hypothetical protein